MALSLKTHRILIVDDYRDAADSLGEVLRMFDADVRVAYDGDSAVAHLADFIPTSVLLDLSLAGEEGVDVARRLRQVNPGHPMKMIAVTGWGRQEDRDRSAKAGFDTLLVKPVDIELLMEALQ